MSTSNDNKPVYITKEMKHLMATQPQPPQGEQASSRRTYAEAQHEGNIRHLARRSGATWVRGLDGFAISEQDLAKLLDGRDTLQSQRDELLAALENALTWNNLDIEGYHEIAPDMDMLEARDKVLRAAIARATEK